MIKVNGKQYESHVEAMNELKIDKKHIQAIRNGLAKHGKVEIGKHTFVGTYSPKKARAATSKKAAAKKSKKNGKVKQLRAKRTPRKPQPAVEQTQAVA
jgi:hypothetical protein